MADMSIAAYNAVWRALRSGAFDAAIAEVDLVHRVNTRMAFTVSMHLANRYRDHLESVNESGVQVADWCHLTSVHTARRVLKCLHEAGIWRVTKIGGKNRGPTVRAMGPVLLLYASGDGSDPHADFGSQVTGSTASGDGSDPHTPPGNHQGSATVRRPTASDPFAHKHKCDDADGYATHLARRGHSGGYIAKQLAARQRQR